jgi:hypothetical protein
MEKGTRTIGEPVMQIDLYTKLILTVIAGCLLVLVLRGGVGVSPLAAQGAITCQGQMTANEHGGTRANVGGYQFDVSCP